MLLLLLIIIISSIITILKLLSIVLKFTCGFYLFIFSNSFIDVKLIYQNPHI